MTVLPLSIPEIIRWPVADRFEIKIEQNLAGFAASLYEDGKKLCERQIESTLAIFGRCVWKGFDGRFESRLFLSKEPKFKNATLIVLDIKNKEIFSLSVENFNDDTLKEKKLTIKLNANETPCIEWKDLPESHDEPAAENDIVREPDYLAMAIDFGKTALSTRISHVAASALAVASIQTSVNYSWKAISFVAEITADYVIMPIAKTAINTLGYPALAAAGVVAVIEIADALRPEQQIIPKIRGIAAAGAARIGL